MNKKILVVDDDAIIRKALSEFLSAKGFVVLLAENGEQGLVTFKSENPDLIILDLVMPIMGGIECLEKIREENSDVPVIILTGYGTEDQITRLNELGISDVVAKGTSFEDFLAIIDDVIRTKQFRLAPISDDPAEVKILIADDDTVIRTLLVEFLTERGFNVLSAKDGEEADEIIKKQKPAIVFLDLVMPRKDGKSVIKDLPETIVNATRWIFITANRYKVKDMRDIVVPYGILEKPFSLVKFEKTVRDLFSKFSIKI